MRTGFLEPAVVDRIIATAEGHPAFIAGLQEFREHLGGAVHATPINGIRELAWVREQLA